MLTADDCDDADPDSSIVADDSDCDGFVNASDCLPEDPAAPRSAVWTVVESHSLATAPATANWCDGAWGGQGPAEVGGRAAWLMSSDGNSLWVSLPFSETDSMLAIQADMHLGEGSRSGALAAMIDPNGVCHLSNHGVNLSYSNERCAEGARNCLRVTGAESGVVHEGDSTGLFNDWITFRWEIFRDDGLVQLRVDGELETCFYATEAELAGSHMKFNANTSCCSLQPDLGASDLMFETGQ